ncbi:MAG: penicillin-binding protein 2 [Hyphomicrobium sp.]|nr:penicillin-binding protein 2 [Hyphomicrobium sp.]
MQGPGDEPRDGDSGFTRRALVVGALQAGALGLLAARLYQLQVLEGRRYAPLAEDNRISQRGVMPRRGRIVDRAGVVLAANDEMYRVSILSASDSELKETLARLAAIVPLSEQEIATTLAKARTTQRNEPLIVAGNLSFDQVAAIGLHAASLPGVETDVDLRRRYFHGRETGHVTGYVGSVERHAMDDEAFLRMPGARVGKAGVELGMDKDLRGKCGSRKFEVDARGHIVRHLDEIDPVEGRDVMLTIDAGLQSRVLDRLAGIPRGAVVAIDVTNGEVVLMASVPAFDPNDLTINFEPDVWKKLQAEPHKPLLNRAIGGQYPPGSTFKMVTALAALEAGTASLRERVTCDGSFEYKDSTFRCWNRGGHGAMDLTDALRESCDVYFYELARRTGIDRIAAMARRLGLGQTYAAGIGQQKRGIVPDPGWKRAALGKAWLGGETILAGIGQGFVLTTPLQLAVMTARLATGRAVVPTLVRRPDDARPALPVFPPLAVKSEWLDAVRSAMVGVVNDAGGTGGNAAISDSAVVIAGKTGTSQVRSTGGDRGAGGDAFELRDHALFVSYFPADKPRYAIAAVIEHGGGGGATAAPIVRDVIETLIDFDPAARVTTGSLERP